MKSEGSPFLGTVVWTCLALLLVLVTGTAAEGQPAALSRLPVVEVEEDLYSFAPTSNGAGPMWCHGATCLVRIGDEVFASGIETVANAKPLNNCRWMLFRRPSAGCRLA